MKNADSGDSVRIEPARPPVSFQSRAEFERGMAEEVLSAILKEMGEPARSTLVDMVSEDEAQPQKLEALIREKRKGNHRFPPRWGKFIPV